ncbi:MAG: sporulation initiation factor Spo0A C-terminal domain-containing protein [Ruminococcus sp.]|nr:sporulation initiation factor Spo0A C-terminal domain-containing protein [Ruminococcus sp.]
MHNTVEKTTSQALLKLGIAPNTKGYRYLLKAVDVYSGNTDIPINSSKMLYPKIAGLYNKSSISVVRAIRSAIHNGYVNRDVNFVDSVFGNTLQGKNDIPTNMLFVSALTEWIERQ